MWLSTSHAAGCTQHGAVRVWDTHLTLVREFQVNDAGVSVTSLAVLSDGRLVTASGDGTVAVWCVDKLHESVGAPPCLARWQAHDSTIVTLVSACTREHLCVATCGADGTVRLWTAGGVAVGVFGQARPWLLGAPATYVHGGGMDPAHVVASPQPVWLRNCICS